GFRGQICLADRVVAIVTCGAGQQTFEIPAELINRCSERCVQAILLLDTVEGLLPLQCVEPACEDITLSTTIALPQLGSSLVIDRPGDLLGQRVQGVANTWFHRSRHRG